MPRKIESLYSLHISIPAGELDSQNQISLILAGKSCKHRCGSFFLEIMHVFIHSAPFLCMKNRCSSYGEQKPEMPVECVSTGIVIAENRSGLTDVVLDIPR
ncbi:hypothetical protein NW801_13135 [Brevibacillus laterosporus]|uniref:Uncharacterized protein n=1 Tax=Brevibacillus halotolerans TaxID=1507437 RepID=A0ABT4HY31_9BACL|nr:MULTISPECIES: hypothetical protein [Brevibacillus]MCR8985967.1 hypothetical protein [Brevibacillus laterosporus]MCZ0831700.1 hypothetical protein [Brevibacillus halotolerans]